MYREKINNVQEGRKNEPKNQKVRRTMKQDQVSSLDDSSVVGSAL